MATFISHSAEATVTLGEAWAQELAPGSVIGITGDLGAGKTQLVKGLARGLGVTDRVQSPTFGLVNEYRGGRLPLAHIDLYRLETTAQIAAAGLEEFWLHPAGLVAIEWAERWFTPHSPSLALPGRYREVIFEHVAEHERLIHYRDFHENAGA